MTCAYGFRAGTMRLYEDSYGNVPSSIWALAIQNFAREWKGIRRSFRDDEFAEVAVAANRQDIFSKVTLGAEHIF